MKKYILILLAIIAVSNNKSLAQDSTKQYKIGHEFQINIPKYMERTSGINGSAAIEFKNDDRDVFGFVVQDTKEELGILEITFAAIDSFYDFFIKDFIKDADKRNVSKALSTKKANVSFIESDFSYLDTDTKVEIYYFIGIVETKTCYYKVLCCCSLANKDKFKADYQKILYSLRD
ncbi:MAG: hypothetical protein SGJ10_10640 [Bacteroidota bacterium]|nr:hypothetical protein [Bacteroidota bacterium]